MLDTLLLQLTHKVPHVGNVLADPDTYDFILLYLVISRATRLVTASASLHR